MIWKNIQQRLLMSGSSGKRSSMIVTMAKGKDQSRAIMGIILIVVVIIIIKLGVLFYKNRVGCVCVGGITRH